jgi:glyoxylase-like metal-dependent hydrolase (beta-lactamase superfamily II)
MKKVLLIIAGFVLTVIVTCGIFAFILFQKINIPMKAVRYDPQMTIYLDGSCNSAVLSSRDGKKALVIDTKMGDGAVQMRKAIKAPDVIIINTHFHMDHVGGNNLYSNSQIIAGDYDHTQWNTEIIKTSRFPDILIKRGEEMVINMDGEKVHIRNMGLAHSWNDVVVYFEKRKLLMTGDLVFNKLHPVLPPGGSCSVSSWIRVLDDLKNRFDIRVLVPGHGGISDKNAVTVMRDYFTDIGGSIGDPARQKELKARFKDYFSVPVIMNFDNTLHFIEKEKSK